MPSIFISFSTADGGDIAEHVYGHYQKKGYDVFLSTEEIAYGHPWPEEIKKRVEKCDIFLLIATYGAIESKEVAKEIDEAKRLKKRIIPCRPNGIAWSDLKKLGVDLAQGPVFRNEYELVRKLDLHVRTITPDQNPTLNTRGAEGDFEIFKNVKASSSGSYLGTLAQTKPKENTSKTKGHEVRDPILEFIDIARKRLEQEQYDDAIKIFDVILMRRPGFVEALNGKGVAFCKQKKYKEALECFNEVLKIKPRHPEANVYVDIITDRTTKEHIPEVKSSGKDLERNVSLEKRTERKVIEALETPHIIFQRRKYVIDNKIDIGRDHDCHEYSYKCRQAERPFRLFHRKGFSQRDIGPLDISVHDDQKYLSKHHARVVKDSSGVCWVQDLGSKNFTAISHDGMKTFKILDSGGKERLKDGDVVAIVYNRKRGPYMTFRFRG